MSPSLLRPSLLRNAAADRTGAAESPVEPLGLLRTAEAGGLCDARDGLLLIAAGPLTLAALPLAGAEGDPRARRLAAAVALSGRLAAFAPLGRGVPVTPSRAAAWAVAAAPGFLALLDRIEGAVQVTLSLPEPLLPIPAPTGPEPATGAGWLRARAAPGAPFRAAAARAAARAAALLAPWPGFERVFTPWADAASGTVGVDAALLVPRAEAAGIAAALMAAAPDARVLAPLPVFSFVAMPGIGGPA